MARGLISRRAGSAVALVVCMAACNAPSEPGAPTNSTDTAVVPSARPTSSPAPDPPADRPQTPLVLAVHASRTPLDVTAAAAQRIVAGMIDNWSELGAAAGPLRVVASPVIEEAAADLKVASNAGAIAAAHGDLGVIALLPAPVVGPTLRALSVSGVDPFRDPDAYPLTTVGALPDDVVTMSFVGDVMLARGVGRVIQSSGDPAAPLRPTAGRLAESDVTIGTLESTLSRIGPPTQGNDSFGADPSVRAGLTLAGFDVLSVAANHLGDFGSESIVETLRLVREVGIIPVGGGADLAEAETPAIVERGDTTIGVLAFNAIGETPRAAPGVPGALEVRMGSRTGPLVPADLTAMQDRVRALDQQVDLVVVMPHWGTQYTHQPEPDQRVVGRALIDAGADLVVGGHPHWVQGVESYEGAVIAHSLGNYVFDMDWEPEVMEGVILDVTLWDGEVKSATFAPIRIDQTFTPHELPYADGAGILDDIWRSSLPPFARPTAP
jgi:poly-gamma-glutamate synthesis protein (capsule biosynthesis protein)